MNKNNIADFVKKADFDDKLKNLNKNVTSNTTKHLEDEKKITNITNRVAQISEKEYDFLLGRMYFKDNDGHSNFLVFVSVLSSIILDSRISQPEYHLKKLNQFKLNLNRQYLI